MARYQHIWLLAPNGVDGLCGQPYNIDYFSPTGLLQAWPSHGNYDDASILTDGSTGTRVEYLSDINADNPDFFGQAAIDIDGLLTGTVNPPPTAELVVYYKADMDHRIFIRENAGTPRAITADAVHSQVMTDPSPLGSEWRKARLTFSGSRTHQSVLSELFEHTTIQPWRIEVLPPQSPSSTYHLEFNSWVSEIAVGYATQIKEEAHCRNFPRDDRLGVGSARNYPTAKSRQQSARGFGYY